ncbi:MAG: hypothetical protein VB934_10280 [Polyangiaceae bacterium]
MNQSRPIPSKLFVLLALVFLTGACTKSEETGGLRGELDAGTFFYHCHTNADAQCDTDAKVSAADEVTGAFPPIAVGSLFGIEFEVDEGFGPADVVAASDDFLVATDGAFEAIKPGIVALVTRAAASRAIDLVHINLFEADGLRISRGSTTTESVKDIEAGAKIDISGSDIEIDLNATVEVTTTTFLRAAPVTADGRVLAGSFETMWTSSDEDAVRIATSPTNNVVEIDSTPGTSATITVTMGELSATITIDTGA